MSNVNLQSDDNLDDNHIRTRLLGLEIENGHLNYGTIVISGRGTSKVIFKDIDRVTEIRKLIKN